MNSSHLKWAQVLPVQRALAAARTSLSVVVLAIATAVPAKAQEPPSPVGTPKVQPEPKNDTSAGQEALSKKWVIEVTPYAWATGVSGSLQPFSAGRTIEFDESFSDVLEDLNSAFFLAASAQKGRLVFVGDLSFVDLSQEGVVPPNVRARGSLRQVSLTLAVGYQAVAKKKMILDVLLGFRSWLLKPGVEAAEGGIDVSREKSFTDIVVGTRRKFRLSDDWSLLLYGDVGIFRVGSHSTSQLVGTVGYQASRDFFLSLGYRELSVDYREDGSRVDARLSGPIAAPEDGRFRDDKAAMMKLANSMPIAEVSASKYDVIFLAGGWGASYDLAQSTELAALISEANAKGAVIGSVCHGTLGLLKARDVDGSLLIEGRRVTGVTDRQIEQLGIKITPMHPETELRAAKAKFEAQSAWRDFFATHTVVDGNLVTGQNQNSSYETAHRILELVANK